MSLPFALRKESVTHSAIARDLLALLCGMQGSATLAIDLNRTHATNPLWPRHARFHLVWQAVSYALLSLLEIALILAPGPFLELRFYLAAILACIPMVSCLAAFACRKIYGGALFDPNGIQPTRFAVLGFGLHIDVNLTAEIVALLMLAAIVGLFKSRILPKDQIYTAQRFGSRPSWRNRVSVSPSRLSTAALHQQFTGAGFAGLSKCPLQISELDHDEMVFAPAGRTHLSSFLSLLF